MQELHTVKDLLAHIKRSYTNPKAVSTYIEDRWVSLSTSEFLQEIEYLALALHSFGVKKGDKIGIFSLPSGRWTIADFAIMAAGGVSVPLFANLSSDNFNFEVSQTEMKTLFYAGKEPLHRCLENPSYFTHILSLDDHKEEGVTAGYQQILETGRKIAEKNPDAFQKLLAEVTPGDMATIIYTSGSTGIPKGAVHTQESIFSMMHTDLFHWDWKTDVYLSFLPTAHVLARTVNTMLVSWGVSIYYYNDIRNLGFAFKDVKPTFAIVVPRLLEKIYSSMTVKVNNSSFLKRKIGRFAFKLAFKENLTGFDSLLLKILDPIVYKHLREALGGHLRVVISGGAPLNPKLCTFYRHAGFPIYEGYGLTEACPVTVNLIEKTKVGTVGPAIDGMKLRVTKEGELLIKGPMQLTCYYKNPEQTKHVLDDEGWLHTGDKATIDSDGYVRIVGRMKELMKTSTGEMIAPIPIEQALSKCPYVEQALVVADNKKFASALLVPDLDNLETLKKKRGLTNLSNEQFVKEPIVNKEISNFLSEMNKHLNPWEKIREYRFILTPLTIESGDLTPSLKIRRDAIEKKYKNLIDSIYEEEIHEN